MCQRPERAYFISTGTRRDARDYRKGVSTPWTGLLHFYRAVFWQRSSCQWIGVNALNGLTSFLHSSPPWSDNSYNKCVNALNGLTSFLHGRLADFLLSISVCQRPERAYFISTSYWIVIAELAIECVNALNGLTSFLRYGVLLTIVRTTVSVNALNGLTSFLRYPLKPLENTGFPASFLQVFVRLFWKQLFSADFLACS